jgi:hypothetical protein
VDAIERLARALHPEVFTSRVAPGGAGFSLRGLVLARTKTHRLKPAPPVEEACACAR